MTQKQFGFKVIQPLLLAGLLGWACAANAATTDIADVPLTSSSQTLVKPNVMFILDTSGSMGRDYMPDEADYDKDKYGFYAAQCNGLAYNPDALVKYPLPVDAAGNPLAAGTFTFPSPTALNNRRTITTSPAPSMGTGTFTVTIPTASTGDYTTGKLVTLYSDTDRSKLMIGTVAASGWNNTTKVLTVNVTTAQGSGTLSSPRIADGDNRPFYFTYSGNQTKLGYKYDSSGLITNPSNISDVKRKSVFTECDSVVGVAPGKDVFVKEFMTPTHADLQKYRDWYTYYRTRMLMMKSAASLAFKPIGDNFRVGFTTIKSRTVDGGEFLDVNTFDTTHKTSFYSQLASATPDGFTPLRGALSKAGQYFAKKAKKSSGDQTYDPMQYHCQRNYAILTTDGYWNSNTNTSEEGIETATYGPYALDGALVGQQDGAANTDLPMRDSSVAVVKEKTSNLQEQTITPQWTTATSALQEVSLTPRWTTATSALQQRSITSGQTSTSTLETRTMILETRTTGNGNSGSPTWTAWAPTASCVWDSSGNNRRACRYVLAGWSAWTPAAGTCSKQSLGTSTADNVTWSTGIDCQYTPWSAYANTASCTALAQSTGPTTYTRLTATRCIAPVIGAWTNTGSCTASATNECRYNTPVNTTTTSCTAVPASTASPYTVGTAVQCTALAPLAGPPTNVATCTASSTTGCQYSTPVNTTTTSCTPVPASTASPYTVATAVQCTAKANLLGPWTNVSSCTTSPTTACRYTAWPATWTTVTSCTAVPQSPSSPYTVGVAKDCQVTSTGGSSNTLADVAMYYYNTDLRTGVGFLDNCKSDDGAKPTPNVTDVCKNEVAPSGNDTAKHQHMTTFTVGMGVSGILQYQSNYATATSGDYFNVTQGTQNWPIAGPPSPVGAAKPENIDDLWHAAINGRGAYFSADDPGTLATSLSQTLAQITAEVGAGSAAAASTLQPIAGDNTLFIAKFKSGFWIGDLEARDIDPQLGTIAAPKWRAAQKLQAKVNAGTPRTIYYFKRDAAANTGVLRDFNAATHLSADGLLGLFAGACSKTSALSQCSTVGFDTTTANDGATMVGFLRGQSSPVYRTRVTNDKDIPGGILGDVIGGAPVYVRQPSFKYTENNYAGFVADMLATNPTPPVTVPVTLPGRRGVVYVAANDGMLHAFDGRTGEEIWAYVPSMVMDRMYQLADMDYGNRHKFFVNGAPVVGDIYVPGSPGTWKTILVGGLGAGGRGYYALDITNPDVPKALWEFAHDKAEGDVNLGLTFGNPVITKRANGKWVVVFSSGYNNVSPGDGNGHLYVVDANTGKREEKSAGVLLEIATFTSGTTEAGDSATPSGLGKINAWVDSVVDNTAKRFYGGDLLGNLWRFDIDNLVAPNQAALRLANMSIGGVAQPITTQPKLAEVDYAGSLYPVVYVGTGQYLGAPDLLNTQRQSVYALKDPMTNTSLGDVHASSSVIAQTIGTPDASGAVKTINPLAVNWATDAGWRIDLPGTGERVNVDMLLLNRSIIFSGNTPTNSVCSPDGTSTIYELEIGTGLGDGISLGGTMMVGLSWVTLESPTGVRGGGRSIWIGVGSDGGDPKKGFVKDPTSKKPDGRRTSWRELVN
jgi:type IV pilus assembly protein PilY1